MKTPEYPLLALKTALKNEVACGFDAIEESWMLDRVQDIVDSAIEDGETTIDESTLEEAAFESITETPYWAQAADRFWRILAHVAT